MKVVEFLKQTRTGLSLHAFEMKDILSPTLRQHWLGFKNKANHSLPAAFISNKVTASNDDVVQPLEKVEEKVSAPITMKPEAEKLYHELTATLGEVIHTGDWLVVDQPRINKFADVTEDHQWIHTDPERATEESPFKTTIAHGFLTLSLLSVLTDSVDPEKQKFPTAKMTVNMGFNQIRFPYPVKSDNRIRATTTIKSVTPVKRGLEIVQELTVQIEGVRRPGCVAESVIQLHF
ncbi:MaoC family dehydratase [Photobacterium aphoticum]|uniref:Dehydratase n=1 Tax=Photobacterium aphoticum TaxID=754436 RepID=A0A0J1GR36_9GAMM|nr:MaoC family dehydratase [Photobacterium aphoticum]KLV01899.1 dehydratase [Photobacterium aphoticum]PSU60133.1 MaoC family dehydratase [Photobacterium aphoticum]GHA33392.1 MaoC family dehydratase [Photobacterium aphoticum]